MSDNTYYRVVTEAEFKSSHQNKGDESYLNRIKPLLGFVVESSLVSRILSDGAIYLNGVRLTDNDIVLRRDSLPRYIITIEAEKPWSGCLSKLSGKQLKEDQCREVDHKGFIYIDGNRISRRNLRVLHSSELLAVEVHSITLNTEN